MHCLEPRVVAMRRREFFKMIGGGAVAAVPGFGAADRADTAHRRANRAASACNSEVAMGAPLFAIRRKQIA